MNSSRIREIKCVFVKRNNLGQDCKESTMKYCLGIIGLILVNELCENLAVAEKIECGQLRVGQFMCPDPDVNHIDPKTQQPIGCLKKNVAKVWCKAADGIICTETGNYTFQGEIPCRWT